SANLVCPSWPFCSNGAPFAFGHYSFLQWIQMGHRLLAGILFIWTIIFLVKVLKNYRNNRVMYWGWVTTSILITIQVLFGATIIFSVLNLWIGILRVFYFIYYILK